ncbi:histidine kinase [Phaeodactylibacter sp.]|uniref:sensor histidine kinase n=1 Tax=Phaeodactylibacter sp. TaxID=1940289 RepID=UPI0025FEA3B5|nr:histidine kinase [Phaeodactylibacter sp.]MCI4648247.1 histidine kinase [Phaeodactylibacter sp.]MCI5091898.1 histidine kinase [Phaeodactylibacter sp.]
MKEKYKNILFHLAFWVLYLASEYLANYFHYSPEDRFRQLMHVLEGLPTIIAAAYLTAYFLVPRYLERHRTLPFLLGIAVLALLVFAGQWGMAYFRNYLEGWGDFYIPPSKVVKNTIRDYSLIALAVCLKIINDWRLRGKVNRQLKQGKAEAELKLLRAQLHPHFLFNTLNNIYGLSLQQPEKVPESILQLSRILDYLVYYSQQRWIPLAKEVELLQYYLSLEKLRYGQKLNINAALPAVPEDLLAAPLLLLPFVENAFKHSARDNDAQWWIKMQMQLIGTRMAFNIENSKKERPKQSPKGTGLRNIKERLALLYPDRHHLTIDDSESIFSVRLELELV